MANKSESRYYVIWIANTRGILFGPWEEVRILIDGYPKIKHEGFKNEEEAYFAFSKSYEEYQKWKNREDGIESTALW